MKKTAGIVFALILFLGTLELGSYVLRKSGFQADEKPLEFRMNNWSEVLNSFQRGSTHEKKVADILITWHLRHQEIDKPKVIDLTLRNEIPRRLESDKNLRLFGGRFTLRPETDDVFRQRGKDSGKIKYEARYIIGKDYRRLTGGENRPRAKRNVIFLGCSFTFGEGVNQEGTFPALIAKRYRKARVYNLGVPVMSPSTSLEQLIEERWNNFGNIDTTLPTTFVYTFIDDHMRRVVGTSLNLSNSEDQMKQPYFYLKDGKLQYKKHFQDDFFNLRWLLRAYGLTNFAEVTQLELPLIGDYHLELLADIFAEIRDRLLKKFPNSKFYVSFYPGNVFYKDALEKKLLEKKVNYFDHGSFDAYHLLNGHFDLGANTHPSALANSLYSEFLLEDLRGL